jgi:hypothetical protein
MFDMKQDYGVELKIYIDFPLKDKDGSAVLEGTYGIIVEAESPHEALKLAEEKLRKSFAVGSSAKLEIQYFSVEHP